MRQTASMRAALHDSTPTWHNPRILLTLLLIFLCGMAAGAVVMRARAYSQVRASGAFYKEGGKVITLNKFRKELSLTEDQAKEFEIVLDDFLVYYQTLQTQMDDVRADGKKRIMRILTPDQKVKFEQMISELQGRIR